MSVTTKAKSAIFHVNASLSGVEKAQLHLMQAKAALRKDDIVSREHLDYTIGVLGDFVASAAKTVQVIESENPGKGEEG